MNKTLMYRASNLKPKLLFGYAIVALTFSILLKAGDVDVSDAPGVPVAHWAFEKGARQTVCNNVNPGTYDGYRGRKASDESKYDARWVSGLKGSSSALKFTNRQIVTIKDIAVDTDGDRIADSGPFTGSFSIFMRVEMSNDHAQYLLSADKGRPPRGFYFDTLNGTLHDGEYRLKIRFYAGSPSNSLYNNIGGGAEDIAISKIHSIGFTFLADPNPDDEINGGSLQYYVNGKPFHAPVAHNVPCVGVNGEGLWIGGRWGKERGKGTIIDDLAIWDKVLTPGEMMYLHNNKIPARPVPEKKNVTNRKDKK